MQADWDPCRAGENRLTSIDEMKEIFGLFLMVLIGLELVESMKTYLTEHVILAEVEIILLIAMIAVARKVIIMDIDKTSFRLSWRSDL